MFHGGFRLLSKHAVRAIRGTRTNRCKVFSSESGLYCDLYNLESRCEACKGIQGIVLYPLGSDYLENVEIDSDVKELWHKVSSSWVRFSEQAQQLDVGWCVFPIGSLIFYYQLIQPDFFPSSMNFFFCFLQDCANPRVRRYGFDGFK